MCLRSPGPRILQVASPSGKGRASPAPSRLSANYTFPMKALPQAPVAVKPEGTLVGRCGESVH